MTFTWAHTVLDGMEKSLMQSLFPSKTRVVDLTCGACGQDLGIVTESANGPWLTVWVPDRTAGNGSAGGTMWSMAAGPLPFEAFTVRCLDHGPGSVDAESVRRKVDASRAEGSCQSLPVSTRPG